MRIVTKHIRLSPSDSAHQLLFAFNSPSLKPNDMARIVMFGAPLPGTTTPPHTTYVSGSQTGIGMTFNTAGERIGVAADPALARAYPNTRQAAEMANHLQTFGNTGKVIAAAAEKAVRDVAQHPGKTLLGVIARRFHLNPK